MDTWLVWSAVGIPLFMTAFTIAALRFNRERDRKRAENAWRDRSLDDWRRERDAQAAHAREQRTPVEEPDASPPAPAPAPREKHAPKKRRRRQ